MFDHIIAMDPEERRALASLLKEAAMYVDPDCGPNCAIHKNKLQMFSRLEHAAHRILGESQVSIQDMEALADNGRD